MQKIFIAILVTACVFLAFQKKVENTGSASTPATTASTTVFTLTTSSQRILATSTKRTAYTVQPTFCTITSSLTYVRASSDAPATSATGVGVYASTTERFIDDSDLPVSENSIQAITNAGTCTVIVTEWREAI